MKTSRDQLKALMKEILIEILSEGLGNVPAPRANPMPRTPGGPTGRVNEQRQAQPGRRRPDFDPRLDTPVGARTPTDALKEAVKREAGGNPIMADILADTAMTTLPTQLGAGDSMGQPMVGNGVQASLSRNHAPTQQEQFHGDPAEIFGEAAQMREDGSSHWADLAFMPSGKKPA